jgi:hypothetical protein
VKSFSPNGFTKEDHQFYSQRLQGFFGEFDEPLWGGSLAASQARMMVT